MRGNNVNFGLIGIVLAIWFFLPTSFRYSITKEHLLIFSATISAISMLKSTSRY